MTTKTENAEFGIFLMVHSPNPILVCKADSAIAYVNPAFEKLTGFRAAELIGANAPYPWWLPETIEKTLQGVPNRHDGRGQLESKSTFRKKR